MNELPPFWNRMTPQDQYEYSINPNMREPLARLYIEGNMRAIPQGGLLEGEIPLPENWRALADPEIGANHPDSRWYQFPSEQGLLSYGTDPNEASSWVDESGRFDSSKAPYDYPKHAPNTPEHKQTYNFLRFNDFGGGI